MGKFTNIYATFYAPSDLTTALTSEGANSWTPVSGYGTLYKNSTGDASVTFVNETSLNTVAAVGNICWIRVSDLARLGDFPNGWTCIEPFVIRDRVAGPEPNTITIGGQDFLSELSRFTIYRPLGAETITNTTVLAGHNAAAPVSRTLGAGAPAGVDSVILDATTGGSVGCEIRILMDGGAGTHVTVVTEVEPGGTANAFRILDRMPANATSGNAVEFRTRQLRVTNPAPFLEGVEAYVTMNGGSIHATLIAESPSGDSGDLITLRDGLTLAANAGNAVQAKDYSQPSTNDVTTVMSYAQGFSVGFQTGTGTAAGTRYAGGGETVYDILQSIADETGEYFRFATADAPTIGPKRRVIWRRTADVAGVSGALKLVLPTAADVATEYANVNRGILISKPRHAGHYDPITQVIPVAGDPRVTLYSCSAAALAEAATAGYTVITTGLGLYAAPYVKDATLEASIGIHQRRVTFSEVTVEGDNSGSIQSAADKLLRLATTYLQRHKTPERSIEVEFITSVNVLPGNSIEMDYTDPTGVYSIQYASPTPLIVQSVRREFSNSGDYPGVPITYCELSTSLTDSSASRNPTTGQVVGKRLKAVDRMIAQINTPKLVSLAVPGSGGTPPVIGVTDHGALTGLADNDHTQYLMGVTDTSLAKTGQTLGVALKTDPGLVVSSGLGMGTPSTLTAATTNTVSGAGHSHAITATANAKTTVNTLLKGDANGDLTGRFFTLDKLISPEVETASGNLTLDPASGVTVNDGNLSFVGARTILNDSGSLTLAPTAGLILDPADDVINVAASATLKTANWASGFLGTGWGVTYAGAADFRSIYADELHVAAFIADTARVKVGAEYITPSMAIISRNFTIPAVSGTGTLYVEDAPGLDDTPVFADNDWLLLRIIDRPAGGLNVLNVWGQVASYSNLGDGEQSWTFTTRSAAAAAVGEAARRGGIALDFGKSGDGWLWLTTLDPAGSPYLGITTWQGANPYAEGNRSHKLRLGQLSGLSGMHEWGLQAGQNTANFIRFSDLRSEIHGSRLSLYAGDNAELRVRAARVEHYRQGGSITYILPNADHTSQGVLSTGAAYYTEIDENPTSPTTSDYIYNGANQSGVVFLGLGNPTWNVLTERVDIHVNIQTVNFSNDTVALYGQIFASDEMTPLTSEKLIYTATTNTTATPKVQCDTVVTNATQTQWNGARLRLRWEYAINASEEAIRLDPNVPSIAVGNPLPLGTIGAGAGGAGFWTGRLSDGTYAARIGAAPGPQARWNGTDFIISNSAGDSVIVLDGSGSSYFAAPMTLATAGGIWQGSGGSWAAPSGGWKLWNTGAGVGAFSAYNTSAQKLVQVDHDGFHGYIPTTATVAVHVRGTGVEFDNATAANTQTGLNWVTSSTVYSSIYGWKDGSAANLWAAVDSKASGHPAVIQLDAQNSVDSKNAYVTIRAGDTDADTYVLITPGARIAKGVVVGTTATVVNQGQIVADLAGAHDFNQVILQDTTDVAHGMTSLVATGTYGALGKFNDSLGGLGIAGYSEGIIGAALAGYGSSSSTTTATTSNGAVLVKAALKSGASAGDYAANANIFSIANNATTVFMVKGNGDFYYDGTGAAFDDQPDVSLLRTLSRELWGGTIQSTWDRFVTTNRQHLIDAGIMSDGGFINGPALNRLLTGAIWQLNERIHQLEARLG